MAGPGNEVAAGGQDHGRLRSSRVDREQVVDVLKAAFTQGRLDQDELDERVSCALASRTYADLAVLTADLPIEPGGPLLPAKARVSAGKAVTAMTGATAAFAGICAVAANTPDGSPFVLPVVVIFFVLMMTVPTGWLVLLHYWMERRAARATTGQ